MPSAYLAQGLLVLTKNQKQYPPLARRCQASPLRQTLPDWARPRPGSSWSWRAATGPEPGGWGSPVPREAAPGHRLLGDAPPPMIEMVDYVPAFSMPYLALSLHT